MSRAILKQKSAATYVDGKVNGVTAATARAMTDALIDGSLLPEDIEAGSNIDIEQVGTRMRINATFTPPVTEHNALSGRSQPDSHPMDAITGLPQAIQRLDNSFLDIDARFEAEKTRSQQELRTAYLNTIAYPATNGEYNKANSYITFNERIYKANKDTVWTGVINEDWDDVLMFPQEIKDYVANSIEAAASGEFPLQMRPDDVGGTYATIEDVPLADNEQGYLVVVLEDSAGGNAGLYIWSRTSASDPFAWQPFVSFPSVDQTNLQTTFRDVTKPLQDTMVDVAAYVTSSVAGETHARQMVDVEMQKSISDLESSALTIMGSGVNATIFRGTQAQFDVDPLKDSYYLAIIVG